jgi:ABC-type nickel/cobalt efflux system permease component RcnA
MMTVHPRSLSRRALAVLLAAAALVLGPGAVAAFAHPLGNFSVNRFNGVVIAHAEVRVDHVLDLAEIPTAQLGDRIDAPRALGEALCAEELAGISVGVGGRAVDLSVHETEATVGSGQADLPILRLECELRGNFPPLLDKTRVTFHDSGAAKLGWHEVTARGDGVTLLASDVPEDSTSQRLSAYPKGLLSSPLDVRGAALVVRPGGPALSDAGVTTGSLPTGLPMTFDSGITDRIAGLIAQRGQLVAVLAMLAALALGAAHALAPGHGKTVMAFYLAGKRSRSVRAAMTVGATVTATHTASVLVLGVAVTAGAALVPDRLYAWLSVASGLIIAILGVGLLRRAVRNSRSGSGAEHGHDHSHGHAHRHGHDHSHGDGDGHGHSHGHGHRHGHGHSDSVGRGGLVAVGLAGGLVPSPSALVLLLAAVAAKKAWFGVLLVLGYGVGTALTLAAVGVLASRMTTRFDASLLKRPRLETLSRLLPVGVAGGVCLVGVGIMARTLGAAV